MLVNLKDGRCRECGSQLEIIDADDATMEVQCTNESCGDSYTVETDAFNDGAITYYPEVMARKLMGGIHEDD